MHSVFSLLVQYGILLSTVRQYHAPANAEGIVRMSLSTAMGYCDYQKMTPGLFQRTVVVRQQLGAYHER